MTSSKESGEFETVSSHPPAVLQLPDKTEGEAKPKTRRTPKDPVVAEFVAYCKSGGFAFEHIHKHTEGDAEVFVVIAIKR